jgi:ABC-type multidrug transport system fused ATPase/permease subunit
MSVLNLIKSVSSYQIVALIFFTKTLLPIIISELRVHELFTYMVLVMLCKKAIKFELLDPMISTLAINVEKKVNTDAYEKFHRLKPVLQTEKQGKFKSIVEKASNAAGCIVAWGMSTTLDVFGSLIACIWGFWRQGLLLHLLILLCLTPAYWWFKQITGFQVLEKTIRKENRKLHEQIDMRLPRYYIRKLTPTTVITPLNQCLENRLGIHIKWDRIQNLLAIYGDVLLLFVSFGDWYRLSPFVMELATALSGLGMFITQYARFSGEYDDLVEFWPVDGFRDLPKPIPIPGSLTVRIRSKQLRTKKPIQILQGEKINLSGASGAGKSTFLKMLFGRLPGASIQEVADPASIENHVEEYYQNISSIMPANDSSILDYFKIEGHSCNLELITELLQNVWLADYSRIIGYLGSFDEPIRERLSGGEKSRLILAAIAYWTITLKQSFIVLDEPMLDVDFATYVKILQWFFKLFHDKTIVYIAHLDPYKKRLLGIQWDRKLKVVNGYISE